MLPILISYKIIHHTLTYWEIILSMIILIHITYSPTLPCNVTVGCKICCIFSKMNKTHPIWRSIHVIDIQKKRLYPTPILACGTPNVMFDIEELHFLIETSANIRLKKALHDTSDAIIWRSLLINYVMINCVECIWEI